MAWRSSGTNNEEMVDNLTRFQVISTDALEEAFRMVDRKIFVPSHLENSAHLDQPLKDGHLHISAPHIYGSAMEALELPPNSSTSFLNIGSGTGYLSCIVAEVLGAKSINFGIEIHRDVVDHSRHCIAKWQAEKKLTHKSCQDYHIEVVHGNALNIESSKGECLVGFDRIYIGAAVSRDDLSKITKLLSLGGILVGPVDDELVKIVRIGPLPAGSGCGRKRGRDESSVSSSDDTREEGDDVTENYEFTHQVLSGVRFAPLTKLPSLPTTLPARLWSPTVQKLYPDSFQHATLELLLCSNSTYVQPLPRPRLKSERINLAAKLPRVLWLEVFSFTHRKWFEPEQTEMEYLKKRVLEEQAKTAAAHHARTEAENRFRLVERERDLYRLLAKRWQSRIQLVIQQQRQLGFPGDTRGTNRSNLREQESLGPEMMAVDDRTAMIFGSMLQQVMDEGSDDDDDGSIFHPAHDNEMNDQAAAHPSSNRAELDSGAEGSELAEEVLNRVMPRSQGRSRRTTRMTAVAASDDTSDNMNGAVDPMEVDERHDPAVPTLNSARILLVPQPRTVSLGGDGDGDV